MTCVAGDSKYSYYPSPAPSVSSPPEAAQGPIASHATPRVSSAAAPISVPVQTGTVVQTPLGRAANGLHTPAASDDFRRKNLGGGSPAIPRVMANRSEGPIEPNVPSAKTKRCRDLGSGPLINTRDALLISGRNSSSLQ
ncbi:hypothetical protein C8J57DRAFT_1245853 [Mycena rebaudengoi]|nr:hypothetical protein C8J57DRAFT_1245853 [Mycena rebaudengoi]